jgi:hypothetical protein
MTIEIMFSATDTNSKVDVSIVTVLVVIVTNLASTISTK